jgi:hypothetical protein
VEDDDDHFVIENDTLELKESSAAVADLRDYLVDEEPQMNSSLATSLPSNVI